MKHVPFILHLQSLHSGDYNSGMTMAMAENFEIIDGMLSSKHVEKMFGKKKLTIIYWRKNRGLPFVKLPSGTKGYYAIRYRLAAIVAWAKANSEEIVWMP